MRLVLDQAAGRFWDVEVQKMASPVLREALRERPCAWEGFLLAGKGRGCSERK